MRMMKRLQTVRGNSRADAVAPAPGGTNDWQQVSFEFTTGPQTEAVLVRLARAGCPDGVCPIFGKIWYDDFNLERTGGRAAAR